MRPTKSDVRDTRRHVATAMQSLMGLIEKLEESDDTENDGIASDMLSDLRVGYSYLQSAEETIMLHTGINP